MVTIRDVAARAGVSSTTVSHVINATRPVSAELRARVESAMAELGFQPNALARSLRRKRTHTLGMIVPDSANPFFAEVGRGIEDTSFASGYSVILCNSDGDPARELLYLDLLVQKQVDGVLLVPTGDHAELAARLRTRNIPVVVIDRDVSEAPIDRAHIDNVAGGYLATRHLLDLGHRRIGYIGGPPHLSPVPDRSAGYCRALQEAGLPIDDRLIIAGNFRDFSGYSGAQALFALPDPPTAIFAGNDLMAIGVLAAARDAGIAVPDDLSIVGFDDIHLAGYINPPLTTVAQPKYELGVIAAELLLARLAKPDMPPQRRLLQAQLVVRQSTTACRIAPVPARSP
ncbi:MAG: LacI family DNA-binding transcriptional regulator [Caldilineaceae bacterium]